MSIRPIGKRWQVRLRLGADNERFERTLPRGATRRDAEQLEAKIRRAQIDLTIGKKHDHLIDDVLDQWEKTGAAKLKSWEKDLKYRFAVLKQEYTRGKRLSQLVTVAEKMKADHQELNPATVNRYLALLRRCGNLAEQWGWTDVALGRRIKLLPENSDRHVYLTPETVEALARAAGEAGDMVRFAALSGLRLGEMLALEAGQIQDGMVILGTNTKSGLPRGIPLPPEALKIAAKALPWALTRKQLRDRWDAARAAVKRPDVHWHDLRHTYASWLVRDGASLPRIGKLLGHSGPAVTQRYAHLAPSDLVETVNRLPTLGKKRGKPSRKKAA